MYTTKTDAAPRLGALHYAMLTRDCDVIDDQLQQGADVIARNQDGDTALHMLCYPRKRKCSCNADQWEAECSRLDKYIIRRLFSVDKRCLTARDAAGNTPLMSCLKAPDTKIAVVMALMEQELHMLRDGIDFDILNNENESALDLAFASGRSDYVNAICIYRFEKSRAVSVTSTIMRVYKRSHYQGCFYFTFKPVI